MSTRGARGRGVGRSCSTHSPTRRRGRRVLQADEPRLHDQRGEPRRSSRRRVLRGRRAAAPWPSRRRVEGLRARRATTRPGPPRGTDTTEETPCPIDLKDRDDIRETVRERYAEAARAAAAAPEQSGCGCGPATGSRAAARTPSDGPRCGLRRSALRRRRGRAGARKRPRPRSAAACRRRLPTCTRARPCSISAPAPAPTCSSARGASARPGKAIGLDMTDEMLALARANAAAGRHRERRVRQGLHRGDAAARCARSTSSSPTA